MKGDYITLDEKAPVSGLQGFIDVMFTSFSFPGFFPPTSSFGSRFIDGSSVETLDILSLITNCRAQPGVESDSDITIDVIMTNSDELHRTNASDFTSPSVLYRFLEVNYYYSTMNGLKRANFTHPDVNYRYVISPSQRLPSSYIPLSLNATDIQTIIDQGEVDGNNAIKNNISIQDHLEYFELKKRGSLQGRNFAKFIEDKRVSA